MSSENGSTTLGRSKANSGIEHFLQELRSNGPWVLTAILPDKPPSNSGIHPTITITAKTIGEAQQFVAEHNGKRNLYYSTNPTRHETRTKAAKTNIASIEYCLADLDPRDNESPDKAKARYLGQLNGNFKPPPTVIVDSGNGIQCLWRLDPPIDLSPYPILTVKDEKGKDKLVLCPEAQLIVNDAEARTKALMLRLGSEAGTQNIDRILRLPGTINLPNKAKREKGCVECQTELISFNGASYGLEAFPLPEPNEQGSSEDDGHHARQDEEAHGNKLERIICFGENGEFNSDRSRAVWWVVCEMVRCGCPDCVIGPTLLNRANKISAHIYDQADPLKYVRKQIADARKEVGTDAGKAEKAEALPAVLDAGDDLEKPPPREWLLGNIFARKFLSSLFGDGGIGKTALRYAQYMSLAT